MSKTDTSTLEARVTTVVSQQLNIRAEDIKPEHHLVDELGADSLDSVELIMELEHEYDLEISDEDAEDMHTVQDVINYVEALLAKAKK